MEFTLSRTTRNMSRKRSPKSGRETPSTNLKRKRRGKRRGRKKERRKAMVRTLTKMLNLGSLGFRLLTHVGSVEAL
jgi:hypothetical protein